MSRRVLIEVAVESPEDASVAEVAGADRLELCAALDFGGLTPTPGQYSVVRQVTTLPVFVMIRPRQGDFVYSDHEVEVMLRDIEAYLPLVPNGFVFGALRPDGRVDQVVCRELVDRAAGRPCVFHRAFDRVPDTADGLDALVALGFARVLTSGRETTALAGAEEIARVNKLAAGRIEVLPCGRVRSENVAEVVRVTGCDQVHGSFAVGVPEGEGRGFRGYLRRSRTSRSEVAAARQAVDSR